MPNPLLARKAGAGTRSGPRTLTNVAGTNVAGFVGTSDCCQYTAFGPVLEVASTGNESTAPGIGAGEDHGAAAAGAASTRAARESGGE